MTDLTPAKLRRMQPGTVVSLTAAELLALHDENERQRMYVTARTEDAQRFHDQRDALAQQLAEQRAGVTR